MSKDAVATVYTIMLNDDSYRELIASDTSRLDEWDLSDEERQVLIDEANTDVQGFAFGQGRAMSFLGSGPPLSQPVASSLGFAMNSAAGLPVGSLQGPGFASGAGCCPWGHAVVPDLGSMQ